MKMQLQVKLCLHTANSVVPNFPMHIFSQLQCCCFTFLVIASVLYFIVLSWMSIIFAFPLSRCVMNVLRGTSSTSGESSGGDRSTTDALLDEADPEKALLLSGDQASSGEQLNAPRAISKRRARAIMIVGFLIFYPFVVICTGYFPSIWEHMEVCVGFDLIYNRMW